MRPGIHQIQQRRAPCAHFLPFEAFHQEGQHILPPFIGTLHGPGTVPVLRHLGLGPVIFFHRLRGPFITLFPVAHGTGIRNAQLHAQEGIGRIEGMIPARIAGHVQAFRHVAFHTAGAHAGLRTRRMPGHVNDGGFYAVYRLPGAVAPQAERVILLRKFQRSRMRVMAVQTGDARLAHAAQAQPGFAIILIPLHAVGPENAGLYGKHELEMVVKTVANGKIVIEFIPPGVAGSAVVVNLLRRQLVPGGNHASRPLLRLVQQGAVALDASHAGFRPGGGIAVLDRIIIFMEQGHVAPRALRVPVHAAARPVPPVPWLPGILAKDIKPFLAVHVPRGAQGMITAVLGGNQVLHQGDSPRGPVRAPGG